MHNPLPQSSRTLRAPGAEHALLQIAEELGGQVSIKAGDLEARRQEIHKAKR